MSEEKRLEEKIILDEKEISRKELQQKIDTLEKGKKIVEIQPNKFKTLTRLQE